MFKHLKLMIRECSSVKNLHFFMPPSMGSRSGSILYDELDKPCMQAAAGIRMAEC